MLPPVGEDAFAEESVPAWQGYRPDMATMLGFVFTDLGVDAGVLHLNHLDGWDGAMFLQEVKSLLEDPTLMFMEMV